jgi:hypothetical protein
MCEITLHLFHIFSPFDSLSFCILSHMKNVPLVLKWIGLLFTNWLPDTTASSEVKHCWRLRPREHDQPFINRCATCDAPYCQNDYKAIGDILCEMFTEWTWILPASGKRREELNIIAFFKFSYLASLSSFHIHILIEDQLGVSQQLYTIRFRMDPGLQQVLAFKVAVSGLIRFRRSCRANSRFHAPSPSVRLDLREIYLHLEFQLRHMCGSQNIELAQVAFHMVLIDSAPTATCIQKKTTIFFRSGQHWSVGKFCSTILTWN